VNSARITAFTNYFLSSKSLSRWRIFSISLSWYFTWSLQKSLLSTVLFGVNQEDVVLCNIMHNLFGVYKHKYIA